MCRTGSGHFCASLDWNGLPVGRELHSKFLKNAKSPPHAHLPLPGFLKGALFSIWSEVAHLNSLFSPSAIPSSKSCSWHHCIHCRFPPIGKHFTLVECRMVANVINFDNCLQNALVSNLEPYENQASLVPCMHKFNTNTCSNVDK